MLRALALVAALTVAGQAMAADVLSERQMDGITAAARFALAGWFASTGATGSTSTWTTATTSSAWASVVLSGSGTTMTYGLAGAIN
jgi:hypothetical protein